jgi:hypothetical protein
MPVRWETSELVDSRAFLDVIKLSLGTDAYYRFDETGERHQIDPNIPQAVALACGIAFFKGFLGAEELGEKLRDAFGVLLQDVSTVATAQLKETHRYLTELMESWSSSIQPRLLEQQKSAAATRELAAVLRSLGMPDELARERAGELSAALRDTLTRKP